MNRKEQKLTVDETVIQRLKSGNPLLHKEDFEATNHALTEGDVIHITDDRGKFVARAYYGKQNVGIGWVLSLDEGEDITASFFQSKIEEAVRLRKRSYEDEETTAFRVFNGEGDGIGGLTIDRYNHHYVVTFFSEGMYTFKDWVIESLLTLDDVNGIYEKKRFATDGKYTGEDDFVAGTPAEFPMLVKESGMHFAVNLNDGPMTGIFLDQREVRKRIRDHYAYDKHVLNLFSYTGAFSVAAALGGATKTTSVDLANRSLEKTEEQFLVNGIPTDDQNIVVMDVFRYMSYAKKKSLNFDVVVIDPPSFARSKKKTFRAAKDYRAMLEEVIAITSPNGVIVASTNASNVSLKKFKGFVQEAFKNSNQAYELLETRGVPEDFKTSGAYPAGNYLKVLFIQKK
ncbi:methyltransferase RlmI [Geomicrobium sp. JCM 19037]|uniref:class I SAM-dependent rRNA methyltransferase n=1 Tax=Geomicrobium sp. JCM 19037 TaxID=1460634 RepID=UPI00045F3519|nr:class I SAM-dependent rRNA methyltransferase [Geomicrobium sp. JCM 19037]GAK04604.1 methyltransferase RlmI [Geomicrobium sp. JCM 19037]